MSVFNSTNEFLTAFGDLDSHGFYNPVTLTDTPVGFSIKKNYPDNIRYKPAMGQKDKQPDNIAAIWVVYMPPKIDSNGTSKVPIRLRISTMSQYRTKHWDYNFDDIEGNSPTKESLDASLATPQPIELSYENEYFYDHQRNSFVDTKNNLLQGFEVLNQVFESHCKTVHLLWGLKLRLKLAWQSKVTGLLTLLIELLKSTLKHLFGRTIETNEMMAGIYHPYKRESLKKLDEDSLDLLGYKASKHVVILFCIFVIIFSIYRYNFESKTGYLSWLAEKEFLSTAHGLLALWGIDVLIPLLLFFIINLFVVIKRKLLFMTFSAK